MLLASFVGFYYIKHGRRQADIPFIVAGVGLMSYGYFVESVVWSLAIGGAIAAGPFVYRRFS